MNKKLSGVWLYYLALIMSCLGISTAFMQIGVNSIFLKSAVVLVAFFFVYSIFKTGGYIKKTDFLMILVIFLAVSTIVLKMLFYGNLLLIAPLMCIACFLIIASLIATEHTFHFFAFFIIHLVGAVILIVAMFTKATNAWGAFQIGIMNPQTIGSWALTYAIGALILFDYFLERSKYKIVFCICEIVVYGFMIYIGFMTEARFSLIVMGTLVLFRLSPKIPFVNNKLVRVIGAFSPMILLIISVILHMTGIFSSIGGGSLLNGRERIWLDSLEQVIHAPFVGVGYDAVNADSFYSHNIFVDYSVLFGFGVALVFCISLTYVFLKKISKFDVVCRRTYLYSSRLQYDAFLAFILILVSSGVEGSFFSIGAGGIFIFSFVPLMVAISKHQEG